MSVKVKNIGLRKIIACGGEILPGDEIILSDKDFDKVFSMFKDEIKVIEEISIPVVVTHTHGKKKKGA